MAAAGESSSEPPDWVPAALSPYAALAGDRTLRIDGFAGRVRELAFDRVDEGWRIEIVGAGTAGDTLVKLAESVQDVRWVLSDVGGHQVVLGNGLGRVDVVSVRSRTAFRLGEGTTDLKLCAGRFRIDGSQATYRARLVGDSHAAFELRGNATLTRIEAEAAKSVHVATACRGDLDVTAGQITLKSAHATGSLTCDEVLVNEDLIGSGDDGITVSAGREIRIGGRARNAVLFCDGVVAIGFESQNEPMVRDVVVDDDPMLVTRGQVTWNPRGGEPVQQCLVAAGVVTITRPVEASLLHAEDRLVVAQGFDSADLDADRLLSRAPGPRRELLNDIPEPQVITGDKIIVDEVLQLAPDQQASAVTSLSARSVAGGEVVVADGTFVADTVADATIRAETLSIQEKPTGATFLTSSGLMILANGADEGTHIAMQGSGLIGASVTEPITWEPTGQAFCDVSAGFTRIDVRAPHAEEGGDSLPELRCGSQSDTGRSLHLEGSIKVTVSQMPRPPGTEQEIPLLWDTVTLGEGAGLHVAAGRADLGTAQLNGQTATIVGTATNARTILRLAVWQPDQTLHLAPGREINIATPVHPVSADGDAIHPPAVNLSGGFLTIADEIGAVTCRPGDDGDPPTLVVAPNGAIADLAGRFKLGGLHGRIMTSRPVDRSRQLWSLVGRGTNFRWSTRARLERERPASLVGIDDEPGDEVVLAGGELVGIAVTDLPHADIARLEELHVFGPDGVSLMEFASDQAVERKHDRAQRLRRLVDVVSANANSGATRSAVQWAAACAQHQAIDKVHVIERAARWLFRRVGYGYRPGPASVAFLLWVIGLSVLVRGVDDGTGCGDPGEFAAGPYSLREQIGRVLLLPISTFRVDFGGAPAYAPVGCSAVWHALCSGVGLLLLGFLVVAIRNYMRTPKN